ncbi:thioredoxin family protein [[Eubacterium] cellulosolvens]
MSKRKRRNRKKRAKNRKREKSKAAQNKESEAREKQVKMAKKNHEVLKKHNRPSLVEYKARRKRQDIAFFTFIIILAVTMFGGYYIYNQSGSDSNTEGNSEEFSSGPNSNEGEAAGNGEDEDIIWHDYDEGLQLARDQRKPVMIDFYTDWCVYCKDMDDTTYSNKLVIAKSKQFISVKVDGDVRQDLTANYSITGYPTTLFLDSEANELHRLSGYVPPGSFLEDMDYVLNNS